MVNDENIDLKKIINLFLRNKILISSSCIIFFILGCLYSYTIKRKWEGQFQIVLNSSNNSSNFFRNNPFLANLKIPELNLGNNISTKNLKTEVEILESPSVLMPIFEFVNKNSLENNGESQGGMIFSKWKDNNLNINLRKGTSILDISYRDSEKSIILPVLNKMTKAYQDYSRRTLKREQELGKNYLKQQINIYKGKASNSLKAAQQYEVDQDLSILSIDRNFTNMVIENSSALNNQSPILPNLYIETLRTNAANRIKEIDSQLTKIANLNKENESLLSFVYSTIPALVEEGLPERLKDVEEELMLKKQIYRKEDNEIKQLIQRKKSLEEFLIYRVKGYLKAEKLTAQASLEAASRPKEVLLKYKELFRQAGRDEATLISLEDQLIALELREAIKGDPWELITEPTLNNIPVSPNRKNIALISTLIGGLIGFLSGFIKEKKAGIIYETSTFDELLNLDILEVINYENKKFDKYSKDILMNEFIGNGKNKNLKFVHSKEISKIECEKIIDNIFDKDLNFTVEDNFKNIEKDDLIILLSILGSSQKNEVEKIRDRLSSLNKKIFGSLILRNFSSKDF